MYLVWESLGGLPAASFIRTCRKPGILQKTWPDEPDQTRGYSGLNLASIWSVHTHYHHVCAGSVQMNCCVVVPIEMVEMVELVERETDACSGQWRRGNGGDGVGERSPADGRLSSDSTTGPRRTLCRPSGLGCCRGAN